MQTEVAIPLASGGEVAATLGGEPGSPMVVFAHGSGSSRHSRRNRQVAAVLEAGGMQTLLLDLLTEPEERVDLVTREHRFDIELLTNRLIEATHWVEKREPGSIIGLFGASTGAAAALRAAAHRPESIAAVVSRGGRTDLAGSDLERVDAAVLLIVGADDPEVLRLNLDSLTHLNGRGDLTLIAGATHLFEEPGKLEEVADLALDWFRRHLGDAHRR
jgi:pimeloyl-ACP methyl ester carboxylesterase